MMQIDEQEQTKAPAGVPFVWFDGPEPVPAAVSVDEGAAELEHASATRARAEEELEAAKSARDEAIAAKRKTAAALLAATDALAEGGTTAPASYQKALGADETAGARVVACNRKVTVAEEAVERARATETRASSAAWAADRAAMIEAICVVHDEALEAKRQYDALIARAEAMFTASGLRTALPAFGTAEHFDEMLGAPRRPGLRTLDDVRGARVYAVAASEPEPAAAAAEPEAPAVPPLTRAESDLLWRIHGTAPDKVREVVGDFDLRALGEMPSIVRERILPLAATLVSQLELADAGYAG